MGVSKDSRLPAEWEVTRLLVPGDNLLAALVLRWSDATYLEDQDMWRMSGLHRDVHLARVPAAASISDIRVTTPLSFTENSSSSSSSGGGGGGRWPILDGAKLEVEVFLEVHEQQGLVAEGTRVTRVTPVTTPEGAAAAAAAERGGVDQSGGEGGGGSSNDGKGGVGWCYDVMIDLMTSEGELLIGGIKCEVHKVRRGRGLGEKLGGKERERRVWMCFAIEDLITRFSCFCGKGRGKGLSRTMETQ